MSAKLKTFAQVLSNEEVAPDVYNLTMIAPEISALAQCGQFIQVRVSNSPVQMLRMPFCICNRNSREGSLEICYQIVGEGTKQLSGLNLGEKLDIIGPLGNGWNIPEHLSRAMLISGGLGAAPLVLLAQNLAERDIPVDVVMGAPTARRLVCRAALESFAECTGGKLYVSTDDGSEGHHGFCTQLSDSLLDSQEYDYIAICGPAPMEKNAVKKPLAQGIATEVSLEKLMACGIGACLSCIVETTQGRRRCCADGPVFNASEVIW